MKTTFRATALAFFAAVPLATASAQNYGYPQQQVPANCPNGVCPIPTAGNGAGSWLTPGQSPNTGYTNYHRQPQGLTSNVSVNGAGNNWQGQNCTNGFCATPQQNQAGSWLTPVGNAPLGNFPSQANPYQANYGAMGNYGPVGNYGSVGNYGATSMIPRDMQGIAMLPANEQAVALQQRTCPVTGHLLGSHGVPVRTVINGRSVYVCCAECIRGNGSAGQYYTGLGSGGLVPVSAPNLFPGSYQHQANVTLN